MSESAGTSLSPSDVLARVKSIKGSTLIIGINVMLLSVFALNFFAARHNKSEDKRHKRESAVVRDTRRTTQVWSALPDGMTLQATSVGTDSAATTKTIRSHLKWRRTEYLRADYSDERFGNDDINGRANLEYGTANKQLNVRYREIPGGAELRWITTDDVMLDSLKEWSAKVASVPPDWAEAVEPVASATVAPDTSASK